MQTPIPAIVAAGLMLAGCALPSDPEVPAYSVPEAVVEMAADYQDLSTARLLPEDGCYWYLHAGPVETTLLPLRTARGERICTRASGQGGA